MRLSQSQQTALIVQSACTVGLSTVAAYFRDLTQLSDVKHCLKGGKFWNGIKPSSYKDTYRFQYGQVMLQGFFCIPSTYCSANSAGSCVVLEVQGLAMRCHLSQVTGLWSQNPRVSIPILCWQQIIKFLEEAGWSEGKTSVKLYLSKPKSYILCSSYNLCGDFAMWIPYCF